ncbi:HlyD family efflux transporter periplasmic adaptor subunit [Roseiconus nitratireducens]|uniref:HlyD family efflux transporter periplasmic adaptor subunit n=1 Tax=Roseiconus nitratireducens TaxID=2605748 RepID=A0A5M6DFJ5_9BACT|nr:efflux RND transporter periplasmic adaptor subunit [Roseiconus nitratireducens]KAA5546301.1 HlyD family efflux transporter periplasmic adaptor subunit [Roseiconus nitratireducens]
MRNLIIIAAFSTLAAGVLLSIDHQQRVDAQRRQESIGPDGIPVTDRIHAAGRVEGTTETILIRPFFAGRIASINAPRGTRVQAGAPLLSLVADRYIAQRDLATAALEAARAGKMRLIEGARQSEIEAANQEALAAEARFTAAERNFDRAERLLERNAISPQEFDQRRSELDSTRALLKAARENLETVRAAPRPTELLAADAKIRAADAELRMAQIDLQRCTVKAPCAAIVLDVHTHVGEWYSPEMEQAAVELVNPERLRVVADIDERDALNVRLGQRCNITTDALAQKTFVGVVSEIEPRMEPKRIYGGWAGERNETHTRRVWIDLQQTQNLPIGLPVEIVISPDAAQQATRTAALPPR